ncbi:hypothetical protein ABI_12840 [Asticcacaulis biprosthecium C19]|uniref:YqcI/YcgG family protein n=1 Tax=Asticcacaulis biprosthecium C19 TaxID=715226 RepID=F4QHV9_9CAUL|nr:guanitoxin biosynthesis heme-dependent pre-guanitoxin N-hydroxylase GntA [Asticcacaulis biprosthecium]EGF92846.1 hypothetical protein ABI_12840 [Asticcacaulis biprosthecium C19]
MYFPTINKDSTGADSALIERFEAHIRDKAFPCVGAKSALSRQQMQFVVAGDIRCPRDDRTIYESLRDFARYYREHPGPFQSFVVVFNTRNVLSETAFEQVMFQRLQALEALDAQAGESYDPRVSADPENPQFSLSFGGEAFFVVALHPGASRPARRFEVPVLVFNAHDQFETLRAEGRYETLRENIIDRDIRLSGTENPMLARHGDSSEVRQYSGRAVEADWRCPLRRVHHN